MTRTLALLSAALLAMPALAQPPQPASAFTARLKALSDVQRRGAIRGAIVNSGERCERIGAVAYQGPWKNLDMWVAHCNPLKAGARSYDYGVFVGPDADVQVRSCADLAALKLPTCRLALLAPVKK